MARKKKISPKEKPHKKRGRPKKPKQRGRPPKPKKRGRPVKKKSVGRPVKKNPVGRPKKQKKKSVGRPKKLGRPSKLLAAKRKSLAAKNRRSFNSRNYNDVKSLLWQTYKNDFPSFSAFLRAEVGFDGKPVKGTSIISKVIAQCPSGNCKEEEVLSIYERIRDYRQGIKPIIPDDAGDMPKMPSIFFDDWRGNFFWELEVDRVRWLLLPDNVWVDASDFIFGETKVFRGRDWNDYSREFLPLIRYLNKFQDSPLISKRIDNYVAHWLLGNIKPDGKLSPDPVWNDKSKRWEVKLFLITASGDVSTFGFSNEVHESMLQLPPDEIQSFPIPKQGEPEPTQLPTEKKEDETDKKIKLIEAEKELEQAKEKRIIAEADAKVKEAKAKALEAITNAFTDGRITFEQYQDMFTKLSI
jgi:hypothetical protein